VQVIQVHNDLDISNILDRIVCLHPLTFNTPNSVETDDLSYYQPGLSIRAVPAASIIASPTKSITLYSTFTLTGLQRSPIDSNGLIIYKQIRTYFRCYWFGNDIVVSPRVPVMSLCEPQDCRQLTSGKSQPDVRAHTQFSVFMRPTLNHFEILWRSLVIEYDEE
jgi:hypothetical protein